MAMSARTDICILSFLDASSTISRVMSRVIIYLGLSSPTGSSGPPESAAGNRIALYSALLQMEFTCALAVTSQAVVSYTAFPPLPEESGGLFLLHWSGSRLHRTLSGILPYEARTFLTWRLSALPAAITCAAYDTIYFITIQTTCKLLFCLRKMFKPGNSSRPRTLLIWS